MNSRDSWCVTVRLVRALLFAVSAVVVLPSDGHAQFETAKVIANEPTALAFATRIQPNGPIHSCNRAFSGVFRGRMLTVEPITETTFEQPLRVLHGESADTIPISSIDANVTQMDWRQSHRWHIDKGRVLPGVSLMFREPGILERYNGYVIGTVGLVVPQMALIAGLLVQRRRRRRAENSMRESEMRFRVLADTAPVMIWGSGIDQQRDFFNQPWLEFRGRTLEQEFGSGWTEGFHPDDSERCLETYSTAFERREPFRIEYRLRRADGEFRWVLDTGVVRQTPDGAFTGYIGSCIDITERKQAEETLRNNATALELRNEQIRDLAGRLINAQEAERARIARELHDDVSQQLAGFSIALSKAKRRPEAADDLELQQTLASLTHRTIELTESIRHLSHELHTSVLELAGLPNALRQHCTDVAKQHNLEVALNIASDIDPIDAATSLCVYRITQEALRNVVKHADARHVGVSLHRHNGELEFSIVDDGHGFDLAAVRRERAGLGLRSIEERVWLVGGRVSFETAPDRGTRVSVQLGVASEAVMASQAGGICCTSLDIPCRPAVGGLMLSPSHVRQSAHPAHGGPRPGCRPS